MRNTKKVVAMILTASVLFSFSVTSFAQEQQSSDISNDSIRINSQQTEKENKAKEIVKQLKFEMEQTEKNEALTIQNDKAQKEKDLALFNHFKAYAKSKVKSGEQSSVATSDEDLISNKELVTEFTEYAKKNGLTAQATSADDATKSFYRAQFQIMATAANTLGYKLAAELLGHSLQDNPSSLSFSRDSWESNIVKASSVRNSVITSVKSELTATFSNYYTKSGSFILNDTTDLHLAIHNCSYLIGAERINGTWNIYMNVSDYYDFNTAAWSNVSGLSQAMVTILNNYAAVAQKDGIIVPYNDNFYTLDTLKVW